MALVEFENVTKTYKSGDHDTNALDDVNMSLDAGKFVVILGPSGAGKSTLLNLLGGLDSPTSGKIIVDGQDISTLTRDQLAEYRAAKVGFVFQFYNLIPTLTVKENVELVSEIAPEALPAEQMIEEVGLTITSIISRRNCRAANSKECPLPCACKKSANSALRRTYRCARLGNRRNGA